MDDPKINIANINLLDDDFDLVHQSLPTSHVTGKDLLEPKPSTLNLPNEKDVNSCNDLETSNTDGINDKHQPEEPNLEENQQKHIDTTHVDEADSITQEKHEYTRNTKVGKSKGISQKINVYLEKIYRYLYYLIILFQYIIP